MNQVIFLHILDHFERKHRFSSIKIYWIQEKMVQNSNENYFTSSQIIFPNFFLVVNCWLKITNTHQLSDFIRANCSIYIMIITSRGALIKQYELIFTVKLLHNICSFINDPIFTWKKSPLFKTVERCLKPSIIGRMARVDGWWGRKSLPI